MASDRGLIPRAGQEESPEPSCGPGLGAAGVGSTPLELNTSAIHHSACLSVGLWLTVAIYLNVTGSKLEGEQ